MRAVLPNCHSLPEAWGYPSPLQPPLFPSPFPSCGWTFSGSILLVSGCNGHLQLLPKGMQHPRNAPASLSSSLGVQPPWTFQGSGGSFLVDTTLNSSHFRAAIPQIQQMYKISTKVNLQNLEDPQMFAQMQVVKRL